MRVSFIELARRDEKFRFQVFVNVGGKEYEKTFISSYPQEASERRRQRRKAITETLLDVLYEEQPELRPLWVDVGFE